MNRRNWHEQKWVPYTIASCSAVVCYLLLSHINYLFVALQRIGGFFLPIFLGVVIAYVLSPLVSLLEEKVLYRIPQSFVRWNTAVACTFLIVIMGIVLLGVALVPQIIGSVVTFFGNLGGYIRSVQGYLQDLGTSASGLNIDLSGIVSSAEEMLTTLAGKIPENLDGILSRSLDIGRGFVNSKRLSLLKREQKVPPAERKPLLMTELNEEEERQKDQ